MKKSVITDIQRMETVVRADSLVSCYRKEDEIYGYCKACSNHSRRWCCPPFHDRIDFSSFGKVMLVLYKVFPSRDAGVMELVGEARGRLDPEILGYETDGVCTFNAGSCSLCVRCAREDGAGCRHPDRMRPSLEAAGFDVVGMVRDLFGTEVFWASDGKLPEYFTFLYAVAYCK